MSASGVRGANPSLGFANLLGGGTHVAVRR